MTKKIVWGITGAGDLLPEVVDELEKLSKEFICQASLLWKIIYSVLSQYIKKNTNWYVYTHEQLSNDPLNLLYKLYNKLGLIWDSNIEMKIFTFQV